MKPQRKPLSKRLGSALVMTLVIIVLITVVTVGYLASVMLETKTAGASLDQEKAYGIAMIGVHQAMARVRDALGPWDDPYKNFATNPPPFYWSLSPGRITRWSYTSSQTNLALFSESASTNLVNLNRPLADGSYPIIGGTNPAPEVSVKWTNVLRDPSNAAGSNNAMIGRYAFWVDDEGAKININTADGTAKYTTNSLGIGTPSEVSIKVLAPANTNLATNIVQIARSTTNFSSPREILRAAGATSSVFTDNVFSISSYTRSPDINIFGQPKMALVSLLGDPTEDRTNMVINSVTLRPGNEIYPTQSQLPDYSFQTQATDPYTNAFPVPWPLAFRQVLADRSTGTVADVQVSYRYQSRYPNSPLVNGRMLAMYLAGTNAAGKPINWPEFPGSSSLGFAGKYTPRQIDSIVAQIISLGAQSISMDYPTPSPADLAPYQSSSYAQGIYLGIMEYRGRKGGSAPYLVPGWLSGQWVIGMGRGPKLTGMRVGLTAYGSSGTSGDTNHPYVPPEASLDIVLEWWLPSAFRVGSNGIPLNQWGVRGAPIEFGSLSHKGALNSEDISPGGQVDFTTSPPATPWADFPAPMPKDVSNESYWANQLLENNQGIDFACNPGNSPLLSGNSWSTVFRKDPDQGLAASHPYLWSTNYNTYQAAGGVYQDSGFATPLRVDTPQRQDGSYQDPEFYPGEVRSVGSKYPLIRMPMQTNAGGQSLTVSGGIAVKTQLVPGMMSDPDPVPLEAVRGAYRDKGLDTAEPFSGGTATAAERRVSWMSAGMGGLGSYPNLRERVKASVIPLKETNGATMSVTVPAHSLIPTGVGAAIYALATVEDPLVNKFPGDWKVTIAPSMPANSIEEPPRRNSSSTNNYASYLQTTTTWYGDLTDPDSYWMPLADCGLSFLTDLPGQTQIYRSARIPNVGYLQYVRTGVIPDDESGPYALQHGTPFRLLSFAPSTEPGNQRTTLSTSQAYPDWAMLDLLYVPSTLSPFGPGTNGGPYNGMTNLAFEGTFGGATAGRINPNGSVIYTTNVDVAETNISRTLPLQAVFDGIRVNEELTGYGTNVSWTNGTSVNAVTLAQAVEGYIRNGTNGALRMPAEICNIPAIAAWRPGVNPTRNDLVRQTVGALTTQGNVFSVWAVGQAIKKKSGNPNYAEFESGDLVLAEVRLHFLVERYLDPGSDGVYGNATSPGIDGVVGTPDDPVNSSTHPFQPRYLYRVVSSEEVR